MSYWLQISEDSTLREVITTNNNTPGNCTRKYTEAALRLSIILQCLPHFPKLSSSSYALADRSDTVIV